LPSSRYSRSGYAIAAAAEGALGAAAEQLGANGHEIEVILHARAAPLSAPAGGQP
jgi:hypothetical protein